MSGTGRLLTLTTNLFTVCSLIQENSLAQGSCRRVGRGLLVVLHDEVVEVLDLHHDLHESE